MEGPRQDVYEVVEQRYLGDDACAQGVERRAVKDIMAQPPEIIERMKKLLGN